MEGVNVVETFSKYGAQFCSNENIFLNIKLMYSRCLKDFNIIKHGSPESSVSRKIFSDHWNVKTAPNSADIIWEHLSVDPESWWARTLIINIVLLIFVLFITTPTVMISAVYQIKASIGMKLSICKALIS